MWKNELSISKLFDNVNCKMILTYEINNPHSLYFPNSSWNQGRNFLLFFALKIEETLNVFFDYYIFADGDVEELKVCTEGNERYEGSIIRPTQPEIDSAVFSQPSFEGQQNCIENSINSDGAIRNWCMEQSVRACEWLCDYSKTNFNNKCVAWHSIELAQKNVACYLMSNKKPLKVVHAPGFVRSQTGCHYKNNLRDVFEDTLLKKR
eukprot:UN26209